VGSKWVTGLWLGLVRPRWDTAYASGRADAATFVQVAA
jgi:hypothetical protein